MSTLLIDSNYIFKKSYNLAKKKGNIDLTILYFAQYIRYYLRKTKAKKVVCFWDGEDSGYYRHLIYKPYKSNRTGKSWSKTPINTKTPQSILIDEVKQFMSFLNIQQIWKEKIEADELISDYIKKHNENIIIISSDSDLYQLISHRVKVLNKHIGLCGVNDFISRFHYHPYNHTYHKILSGDSIDKISKTELISLTDFRLMGLRKPVSLTDFLSKSSNCNSYNQKLKKKFKTIFKVVELHSFTIDETDCIQSEFNLEKLEFFLFSKNLYSNLSKIKNFSDFNSFFSIFVSTNKLNTNEIEIVKRHLMKNSDVVIPPVLVNCVDSKEYYKTLSTMLDDTKVMALFSKIENKIKEGECRIVCSCRVQTNNCCANVIKKLFYDKFDVN